MNLKDLKGMVPKGIAGQIWDDVPETSEPSELPPQPRRILAGATVMTIPSSQQQPSSAALQQLYGDAGAKGDSASAAQIEDPVGIDVFRSTLKIKTDFDSTPIGRELKEHLAPFEGMGIDEAKQVAIALKAGAKDGLTAENVINTLRGLLATLEGESANFNLSVDAATKAGVDSREVEIQAEAAHAKDLEAQVTESRAKQSYLANDKIAAQTKIQQRSSQFAAAYEATKAELQAKIDHYSSILKGTI